MPIHARLGEPDAIKKIIAKRIIGLAGKGEYDPDNFVSKHEIVGLQREP